METSKSKKTIEQLARELKKDVKEVSKIAQQILGLSRKDVRDSQYILSLSQCNQLRNFFEPKTQEQPIGNSSKKR